jgi:hypothetical protein
MLYMLSSLPLIISLLMYQMDHDLHNRLKILMYVLMMELDIDLESLINHGIAHEYLQ